MDMSRDDWREKRPPGCYCSTYYQREQCCNACEAYPEVVPRQFLAACLLLSAVLVGTACALLIYGISQWL